MNGFLSTGYLSRCLQDKNSHAKAQRRKEEISYSLRLLYENGSAECVKKIHTSTQQSGIKRLGVREYWIVDYLAIALSAKFSQSLPLFHC